MFKLVKFSCDCVGTEPVRGISTIISCCDGEGAISFYQRNMDSPRVEKAFKPLSTEETDTYREQIQQLIFDGYSLKAVKSALGIQTTIKKLLE